MHNFLKSLFIFASLLLLANSSFADTLIRGFGEVRLYTDPDNTGGAFQFGPFDIFLSNSIDKKTSYLAELVIEGDDTSGEMKLEAERMYIQYEFNPWAKIAAGRFHTALGYWNETFHHGSFLATAATRPAMYRFEDEGGLLPDHTIGIEVRGNGEYQKGNLGYQFNLGNGRGGLADPPQNLSDKDNSKSVSGVVYYEADGKRFGVNAYIDTIPTKDVTNNTVSPSLLGHESILGAHFVWINPDIEWLNEYMQISHTFENNPTTSKTKINTFYSQFGYHINKLTPYLRVERDSPDVADPYLNISNETWYYTLGARYDLSSASALKAEVEQKQEKAPGIDDIYVAQLNWSFTW